MHASVFSYPCRPGPVQSCQTTAGLREQCRCGTGLWTPPPSLLLDSAGGSTSPAEMDASKRAMYKCHGSFQMKSHKRDKIVNWIFICFSVLLCWIVCLQCVLLLWQPITLWDKCVHVFLGRCGLWIFFALKETRKKKIIKHACSCSTEDLGLKWFKNNQPLFKGKVTKVHQSQESAV